MGGIAPSRTTLAKHTKALEASDDLFRVPIHECGSPRGVEQ